MHARVSTRQIQSGQMDEAIRILRDDTLPPVRERSGFKGGLVLADRNMGKLVTISLWDTEADLRASDPPGYVDAVASGAAVREIYEVSVQETMPSGGQPSHARVAIAQVQPGRMDEMISILRDTNYPAYKQDQGFKGALLLTDPNTGKGISILLWETEADMRAGEASSEERRRRVGETLIEPPVTEHYEVSVQA